jgi:hypothetical protein
MKRPFGLVFSAVILLLLSLFQLLMAFGMAVGGAVLPMQAAAHSLPGAPAPPPIPPWMHLFLYGICVFFLALAAWGIATAVGLFRLRRWARYSILVIGGGLALIGLVSALSTGLLTLVSFPVPSTVDASQSQTVQSMAKIVFGAITFFYLVICAVGVSWLIYFNRKKVREVFAPATLDLLADGLASGTQAPGLSNARPFLISVLAVLNMFGAGFCLVGALVPIPAALFGMILFGWQKTMLYLVIALVQATIGICLWRLLEWGRLLSLGMIAFSVAQCLVYAVRPSLMLQYSAEMNQRIAPAQAQLPQRLQTMMYSVSFGFSILFCIAIAAVLIYYRGAFQHPPEPVQSEPPLLS